MIRSPTGLSSAPPFANIPMSQACPEKWSETLPLADILLWLVPVVMVIGFPIVAAICAMNSSVIASISWFGRFAPGAMTTLPPNFSAGLTGLGPPTTGSFTPSAFQVFLPTQPSTWSFFASWNFRTPATAVGP
jgi:hypothetical protein